MSILIRRQELRLPWKEIEEGPGKSLTREESKIVRLKRREGGGDIFKGCHDGGGVRPACVYASKRLGSIRRLCVRQEIFHGAEGRVGRKEEGRFRPWIRGGGDGNSGEEEGFKQEG